MWIVILREPRIAGFLQKLWQPFDDSYMELTESTDSGNNFDADVFAK